jgi:hypothetical protein
VCFFFFFGGFSLEFGQFSFSLRINAEESLTFSDTLVALRIMRAQFPRIEKVRVHHILPIHTHTHTFYVSDLVSHILKSLNLEIDDCKTLISWIRN